MTTLHRLPETEIEDRYRITGQRPVQFLLNELAETAEPFTVHFLPEHDFFQTTLLAIPAAGNKLIFDCSGSREANQRFLYSDHNIFVARPGGILVQFTTGRASEMIHGGARAFAAALPETLIRRQRRDSFRIETPRLRLPHCEGRQPNGRPLHLSVHNLSCTGLALNAPAIDDAWSPGLLFPHLQLHLPEEKTPVTADFDLRHITEAPPLAGAAQWRLGFAFSAITHADETRLQRYIARLEREKHERSL